MLGVLMTMAPPAANASCTGSEMGIWWKNASTSTQTGTSNRIRKTTGTLEQCGANAGLPIVHTAHFVLGGVFGNWAEAGISLRYDTNGGLYYRVFTEAGLGGNVTQVKGFGTPPCTRVVAAANNYVKLRFTTPLVPTSMRSTARTAQGFEVFVTEDS